MTRLARAKVQLSLISSRQLGPIPTTYICPSLAAYVQYKPSLPPATSSATATLTPRIQPTTLENVRAYNRACHITVNALAG